MDETVWDAMVRVAMTHRILEDGLSPMEALAYVLRQDLQCSRPRAAEVMSRMAGRNITANAVGKYVTTAKAKLETANRGQTESDDGSADP